MSGYNYSKTAKSALQSITKFGAEMIIKRRVARTDINSPWKDPNITPESCPCVGIVTEFSSREIDGQSILRTDKKIMVAASGLEIVPLPTDKISMGSTDYSIISVVPVAPGGDPIIYTIQARNV